MPINGDRLLLQRALQDMRLKPTPELSATGEQMPARANLNLRVAPAGLYKHPVTRIPAV